MKLKKYMDGMRNDCLAMVKRINFFLDTFDADWDDEEATMEALEDVRHEIFTTRLHLQQLLGELRDDNKSRDIGPLDYY